MYVEVFTRSMDTYKAKCTSNIYKDYENSVQLFTESTIKYKVSPRFEPVNVNHTTCLQTENTHSFTELEQNDKDIIDIIDRFRYYIFLSRGQKKQENKVNMSGRQLSSGAVRAGRRINVWGSECGGYCDVPGKWFPTLPIIIKLLLYYRFCKNEIFQNLG